MQCDKTKTNMPGEIRLAFMAIEENKEVIAERWNEYFGK